MKNVHELWLKRSLSLSVQFPTTVFVYIHRNQSSNHSTGNKGPIGKNKGPGSENVHSSEFEILALYIYIIVYNITRATLWVVCICGKKIDLSDWSALYLYYSI